MHALTFNHVSYSWPDGRTLFGDLTFSLPAGLSGMVGRNGIGKSTLLRLATGSLTPRSGTVQRPPSLAYVPQGITLDTAASVADVLGIGAKIAALRAIESGSADPALYEALDDDWLVESRARTMLQTLGLGALTLDRAVGHVSGGEATLLAVGAAVLSDPECLLLDEPTNNLDSGAREALMNALALRRGATLVVTHDRAVLQRVGHIGELRELEDRSTQLRWFGGALDDFEAALAAERHSAEQALVTAKATADRQARDLVKHAEAAGRKARAGEKARAERKVVGMVANAKRNQAEATFARTRQIHEARLSAAREALSAAREAIPRDRSIRVSLPGTEVPRRRRVAELDRVVTRSGAALTATVLGPERIHLDGPNGSGKTTLIETLLGATQPAAGTVEVHVPMGYLPQRLDILDPHLSVVDNVLAHAPGVTVHEARRLLGQFQFRGALADAVASTLSGGERFRAALASVLLARPEPQLLILDEPTNNLDFESQAQLVQALENYQGALLVVSHDQAFVEALAPTRRWVLGEQIEDLALR
jgi:ATPase subunit of ABC transporter with duplicated ATPase domains